MRMMLKVAFPVETANEAISDGSFQAVMQATMAKLNPEASYFFAEMGQRAALFVFDMQDQSEIPGFAEPLFMQLNAEVELQPVMNAEDLMKGLAAVA